MIARVPLRATPVRPRGAAHGALREDALLSTIDVVSSPPTRIPGVLASRKRLMIAIGIAIAVIAAVAFWDEEREQEAALSDFAAEQATLATSVSADIAARVARVQRDAAILADPNSMDTPARDRVAAAYADVTIVPHNAPVSTADPGTFLLSFAAPGAQRMDLTIQTASLLEGVSRVERPREVRLLIVPPGDRRLHGTDGGTVDAPALKRALDEGRSHVWLDRSEAAALGLPPRRAAAGIARIDRWPGEPWGAIVVASAERIRDREQRARLRLILGVTLASGLVLLFGSVALREQRRELLLGRELAIADLARARDRQLATSSRTVTMGTLALGIAHELSTPLGIVAGRAEQLLGRAAGDDRSARCAQAILEQTARIERVVRGFLDLARGGKPDLARVSPVRVVEGAVRLVKHRLDRAGVSLSTELDEPLPLIRCDVAMLEQALVNLLLNACDACGGRDVPGHVSVRAAAEGDRVVITVTDDGAGITEADAARATEPFFTTKPAARGSGFGLAIANEIVKLHLGTLAIGPASPRGTRAAIHIPILRRDPRADSIPADSPLGEDRAPRGEEPPDVLA